MRREERGRPSDKERFFHMRDAALDVVKYVRGRQRADLHSDSMLVRALVNAL